MLRRLSGWIVLLAVGFSPAAASTTQGRRNPECPLYPNSLPNVAESLSFVFFDWNSSEIGPQADRILDNVVSVWKQVPRCRITIGAHADTSGPADYNLLLSMRRADAVAAWLRQHGVRAEMELSWYGEAKPLVGTPDEVREPQNRRAEIWVAP